MEMRVNLGETAGHEVSLPIGVSRPRKEQGVGVVGEKDRLRESEYCCPPGISCFLVSPVNSSLTACPRTSPPPPSVLLFPLVRPPSPSQALAHRLCWSPGARPTHQATRRPKNAGGKRWCVGIPGQKPRAQGQGPRAPSFLPSLTFLAREPRRALSTSTTCPPPAAAFRGS